MCVSERMQDGSSSEDFRSHFDFIIVEICLLRVVGDEYIILSSPTPCPLIRISLVLAPAWKVVYDLSTHRNRSKIHVLRAIVSCITVFWDWTFLWSVSLCLLLDMPAEAGERPHSAVLGQGPLWPCYSDHQPSITELTWREKRTGDWRNSQQRNISLLVKSELMDEVFQIWNPILQFPCLFIVQRCSRVHSLGRKPWYLGYGTINK